MPCQGRHNHQVGTIGDTPASARRPRFASRYVRLGQVVAPSSVEIARAASRVASRLVGLAGQFEEGMTKPMAPTGVPEASKTGPARADSPMTASSCSVARPVVLM